MNLIRNISWTALLHAGNTLFPIITLPLLLSILTVSDYGRFLIIMSLISVFVIIVDFGTSIYSLKLLTKRRKKIESYSNIYSQVLWIKALVCLILIAILCAIFLIFDKNENLLPIIFLTISQGFSANVYFQSIENNKLLAIFTIIIKLFVISPFLLLVTFFNVNVTLDGILYFYAASFLSVTIFSYREYTSRYTIKPPNFHMIKVIFKNAFGFFISRASVLSYTKVNTVVVGVFFGEEVAAYFGTAEKVYNAIRSIYAPITNALYPYMSRTRDFILFRKIFFVSSLLNLLLIVSANTLIELGKESIPVLNLASHYFLTFSIALFFTIPSILYGYPFLGALGYSRYVNLSTLYGSIFYYLVVISGLLMFGLDVKIVIYGIILTELFVFALRYRKVREVNFL